MLRLLGAWLRPVERTVRVREVARSNRAAPTKQHHPRLTRRRGVFFNKKVEIMPGNSAFFFETKTQITNFNELHKLHEFFYSIQDGAATW